MGKYKFKFYVNDSSKQLVNNSGYTLTFVGPTSDSAGGYDVIYRYNIFNSQPDTYYGLYYNIVGIILIFAGNVESKDITKNMPIAIIYGTQSETNNVNDGANFKMSYPVGLQCRNGKMELLNVSSDGWFNFDADDWGSGGVSTLTVSNQGDMDSVLYNGVSYNTFPATINLVSGVTNLYVKGKEYSVTMNNAGNLKSVQVGSITYTDFPRTITIDSDKTMLISGADSPTITVNYKNTKIPEVTDT
jgi:hypothetical protein